MELQQQQRRRERRGGASQDGCHSTIRRKGGPSHLPAASFPLSRRPILRVDRTAAAGETGSLSFAQITMRTHALSLSLVLAFAFARCLLARYLLLNCCRWRVDARAVAEAQLDIPAHHHDSARLAYPFHSLSKQGMSRRANGQTRTDKPPATSGQLLAFRVNAQRPLDGSPADKRSGRERSAGRKGGRRSPIIDSLLVCRCSLCRRCSSAKSFSASVRVATCYLRSSSPAISLL